MSLSDPWGTFHVTKAPFLANGLVSPPFQPYLTLSGTSMAAPVVAGTVALMLQANPALTPNAVKAILQYSAQVYPGYDPLTEGAGFLNTVGAVRLAKFYATAQPGQPMPSQAMWSKSIIWGNHQLKGGYLKLSANAYSVGTDWGVAKTDDNQNIVWGTAGDENIVWGVDDLGNIVWGVNDPLAGIVWGTSVTGNVTPLTWTSMFSTLSDEQMFTVLTSLGTPQPVAAPAPPVEPPPATPVDPSPAPVADP